MKIIYIAGTSHSGSTLLDLMLNAHSDIISGGELAMLERQLQPRPLKRKFVPCTCGARSLLECEFWSAVSRHAEASIGKSIRQLDLKSPGDFAKHNQALYKAMADVSGSNFIVDSSKLPKRLSQLIKLDLDIYLIHLIRDPKGQIHSVQRKHGGLMRHILRYQIVHEQIKRMRKAVPDSVVHYEELVRNPERTLTKLMHHIGLPFEARQLQWSDAEKHHAAGNHMRFKTSNELRLDESWRRGLKPRHRIIVNMGSRALAPVIGLGLGLLPRTVGLHPSIDI